MPRGSLHRRPTIWETYTLFTDLPCYLYLLWQMRQLPLQLLLSSLYLVLLLLLKDLVLLVLLLHGVSIEKRVPQYETVKTNILNYSQKGPVFEILICDVSFPTQSLHVSCSVNS